MNRSSGSCPTDINPDGPAGTPRAGPLASLQGCWRMRSGPCRSMQAREPTSWRQEAPSNFPDRNRARRFLFDLARTSSSLVGSKPPCLLATRTTPRRKPTDQVKMSAARGAAARDQIVKLIVGAGQASPSPPVGPALGSKGIKSMDFCKVRLLLYTSCRGSRARC